MHFLGVLSIGYIKRQEEMQRVQRENQVHNMLAINRYSSTAFLQAILKRIQTVKPQYSVKQWVSAPVFSRHCLKVYT